MFRLTEKVMMKLTLSLLLGLGLVACGHPAPTTLDVERAVKAHYDKTVRMSVAGIHNRVESVTVKAMNRRSESATVNADIVYIESDGSWGASCRNALGCYDRVQRKCTVTLVWGAAWEVGPGGVTCE